MYKSNKRYLLSLLISIILSIGLVLNNYSYANTSLKNMSYFNYSYSTYKQYVNTDFTDGKLIELEGCKGNCIYDDYDDVYIPTPHKTVKIELDGTATKEEAEELQCMLKLVPYQLVNAFVDDGYKILLSSKDLREYVGYQWSVEPSGVYSYNNKTIYLSNKNNNDWAVNTLYHEFGHYVDVAYGLTKGYTGYISVLEPFNSIYKEERLKFKVDTNKNLSYYQSSAIELFAQAFAEYIVNRDRLKVNTPKTYNYVKGVVDTLSKL